jgi:ankyrin repeat protein
MNLRIKIPTNDITDYIALICNGIETGQNVEVMQKFNEGLKKKDFIDECYKMDFYILNYAVEMNNSVILYFFLQNNHLRTYIDTKDDKGKTPLKYAIHNKNRTIVKMLLRNNAKLSYNSMQELEDMNIW